MSDAAERIAVLCVGNPLMRDDGLGTAVYEQLEMYCLGDNVEVLDVGCLALEHVAVVQRCDVVITVDAVDGTGLDPGAIVRYDPHDIAPKPRYAQSLHDLTLGDLFEAALLLGYVARGVCLGMQVADAHPARAQVGLTDQVRRNLGALVDCVLAELVGLGCPVRVAQTGKRVNPGYHHLMRSAPLTGIGRR